MFDETHEPLLVHRVAELLDIGVEYPAHLLGPDPHHERVHRITPAASRSESVAEAEEVLLVDGVQHHLGRSCLPARGDRQRTLPLPAWEYRSAGSGAPATAPLLAFPTRTGAAAKPPGRTRHLLVP